MLETTGNLWDAAYDDYFRAITTNGSLKGNGAAVMGRGCALEAAKRWPKLPFELGHRIRLGGNHVHWFPEQWLWSFPVKYNWWEAADIELIKRSARELVARMDSFLDAKPVVLPRPGCGNGRLDWKLVRPLLQTQLDDRFTIITFSPRNTNPKEDS